MEHPPYVACYRELVPEEGLRQHVRALFSFGPARERIPSGRVVIREVVFRPGDSFCSPLFADGHVSLVVELALTCSSSGHWQQSTCEPRTTVIGPMSRVGTSNLASRPNMLGAYLSATQARAILGIPACELTDRTVLLDELWGSAGGALAADMAGLDEANGLGLLETALRRRIVDSRAPQSSVDVMRVAAAVLDCRGRTSVEDLARASGVSRQHLTRVFRERVGINPKLYCRLARFEAGLAYAGVGRSVA